MQMEYLRFNKADRVFLAVLEMHGKMAAPQLLCSRSRRYPIVQYRYEAAWLMRQAFRWSLPQIARLLGSRHHTSIMAGIARIERKRDMDCDLRKRLDTMLQQLTSSNEALSPDKQSFLRMASTSFQ